MVQGQLRLREQVGPAIGRESDVARRESGDKVVLSVRMARSAGRER